MQVTTQSLGVAFIWSCVIAEIELVSVVFESCTMVKMESVEVVFVLISPCQVSKHVFKCHCPNVKCAIIGSQFL